MSKKIKVRFDEIRSCALFAGVPDKIIKKIALFPTAKEIPAGTTIIKENDFGDSMFVIISGSVDVLKGPKLIKLATLGPGVFVGEGVLVSNSPRNATVVTASAAKVAFFDKPAFDKLIIAHPAIPITLLKVHNERCKDTVRKVNVAKSKGFIVVAAVGAFTFLQNSGGLVSIPHLPDLMHMIPPQIMALLGPAAAGALLKFQKMDMSDIVSKLEKL